MERNFPASGFGELGAGAGWTYDRKPSLMYGSSRSSHPDSELLHRQAYAPPHPLQGYSTNHHPGRQGGGWGPAGRTIGLSGLFDSSLHHAGPSAPDPSVMNLISALDSRGPQSAPPTSSLLSQFRNPSWQTGMHTPAPADLFITGTLPGSSSFPSSSALSAYQPPGSFSGRSFTPSLSLQDAPTYSPSSSSLLSPHDSLLHIKTQSQSSLGFERLLPSQSPAYRGSHEPSVPSHAQTPSSSSCHLPSPKFNLLSPHLHNRSSQLYNTSMFASSPGLPSAPSSQPQTPPEMVISRHDSVIKHYQRSSPAQSSALQQYASFGGSSEYQQAVSHHRHAGVSCSPLGEQSPSTDPKSSPQMETQTYSPIITTPYTSSSSGHSASSLSVTKGNKSSSSTSGYSSSGSASSSSQNPHTPPSASSTSSSCSSSSKTSASSFSVQSCQQLPSQSATAPPPQSGVSSTLMQQTAAKQCLSSHASQSVAKPGPALSDSTPPQHHSQPYSPNQPPPTHMSQPFRDFSSPHSQDMSTSTGASGGKVFTGVPPGGRSFSAEIIYEDSSFGSASLKRSSSPSLGYGSESAGNGHASSVATHSSGVASAGSGSGTASIGNEGGSSYHPPDCSTSPSVTSALNHPALPSPAATECLSQSPGAPASAKYLPPILTSTFISSPQGFQNPSQTYHSTPTKSKTDTNLLTIDRSRDEEENSDFLIHHLLNTQSSTSHLSQHVSRPQQLPQSLSQSRYGEGNGMTYDLEKASDEQYHSQSVIRTGNATSSSGPETATCDTASISNRHREASQMKQQTKIGLVIANSAAGGLRGAESVSHSQNQQQNELGSAVHYGRGDLYPQHSHSQHSHHTSHISSHSQQHTQHSQQVSQHSQHPQQSLSGSHSHSNSHVELNKPSNANDNSYLCNTPSIQQAQQNQDPHSLMDSSPDPPHPNHSSLISHNTHSKMESQQSLSKQPHQQHSLNQSGMVVGSSGRVGPLGLESHSRSHSSQLQLHLQNQSVDSCFNLAGQTRNPTQTNQSSISSLDMLDQSLSCANSRESGGPLDTAGTGVTIPLRKEDGGGERPRQQHKLTPQYHSQQKGADIHDFLAEPDMGMSPSSHLHCLNQPSVHAQSHGPHDQQALTHHQMPHAQMSHHHQMAANMGTSQQTQQSQPIDHETQMSHSQVDQLKQHQFDPMTVADKVGPHQTQQQRYPPLTSICFPDSLLQDEGRSFFPEMEDIYCSSEFKSSCAGDCRSGQIGRESLSQGRQCVKSGGTGEDYGVVGSRSDQSYGQYCHNMLGTGGGNLHLDLDSLKTHELPSTVNTEQLGLIQSQTPNIGLGSGAPGESSVSKMMGAVGGSSNTSGLTSPIFCSTRPKKLLKTSSFHLLKQRREPQPLTKKNYAQEYEFEDDEDKADVPADIRLNTRRLPDLLPDLVSSCRRGGGASGVSGLNPVMGDMDFCRASSYSSLGNPPQLLPHDGPKKRGRKPTKPKREGPPRPRGRPRIRPLPEPPYCRGLMGSAAGETRRGRGRGRGRGRRDEVLVETHRDVNKAQSLAYHHQQQQQQFNSQVNLQHPQAYSQHADRQAAHQQPQHHLYQQSQGSCSHHQLHPQQHYQQQQPAPQEQNIVAPIKIKMPFTTLPPSESLLRTDSLSSNEPVLSDGSLGSAPSLGLSPGPSSTMDISRSDLDQIQSEPQERAGEVMMEEWKKEAEDPLNADDWAAVHKLATSVDDFKPAFMASFLDFLKAEKKPEIPADHDGCLQENLDTCSSLKGGMRPLSSSPSSLPSTPPQQPAETFSDEGQGEGAELALSGCPSPCKPLDEELKGNLEALPSFSSDEEDSVSKNQDLQKSISSAISALYDTPHSLAAAMASAMIKAQPPLAPATPQEPSLSPPLPARPLLVPDLEKTKEEMLSHTPPHVKEDEEQKLISSCSNRAKTNEGKSQHNDEEKTTGSQQEVMQEMQNLQEEEAREDSQEEVPGVQSSETPKAEDSPSAPPAPPCSPLPASPSFCKRSSPLPLSPLSFSVPSSPPTKQEEEEEVTPAFSSSSQPSSYHPGPNAVASPPPSTSPPATLSSPLSNLPLSLPIPPPSTTPPPSSSDQDQDPEAGQPSPSSPSSSSASSQPPSPPTPEEAPASQRLTSLHLAKKQADAAIAGESEEEDSESGGEGIFRERDEFVVRTEDIGTLKMALQTGREPPPIWRVQKALLQKFSPEIKDGQRQFCATSNYLGYFGDAKMRYQRLYVKFLENVNKKDYVRVCSRKPWHRAGLTLRRQTLAKQLPSIHAQNQQRMERQKEKEVKEQRDREKLQREHREKMEQREKERKEREQQEKMTKEKEERKQREREKEAEEAEKKEKEQREKELREVDRQEEDKGEREREVNESRNREQREREQERDKKEKEVEQRETEQKEREQREQKERERQERERRGQGEKEKQKDREPMEEEEKKRRDVERENKSQRERRDGAVEPMRPKEEKREEKRVECQSRSRIPRDKAEPPPKKRKKWLKEVPSSSSDSDSSIPSDDEGPLRALVNSRTMREMFRSYVEMLVSTALDPDMIQALEDTDDELYLPPMRKIDSLLSEQKKRLLGRVNMSAQHQEALHLFPKMTADPLESGVVRVHLGGEGYNRKTLNRVKKSISRQQDMKLSIEVCRIYSLYHSLHHYKYHTFLHCKKETDSIEQAAEDPGQEEVVQQCMANQSWLESLFNSFVELLSLSCKA